MKNFIHFLFILFSVLNLQAQDYRISFVGTGASTTVSIVKVENLTQGKSISLSGTEVLHLSATSTGLNPKLDVEDALRIYPNPTTGKSSIEFVATALGTAKVELFDITGKIIGTEQNTLTIGTHSYLVSGLKSGIYTIRISSKAYNYTGKLVSKGAPGLDKKIRYIGASPVKEKMLKSANTEKTMQYNSGDVLKYTGTADTYSTVVTEVPTSNKTITFTFVACTDGDGNNYPVEKMGTQIWMAENLKTTKYSYGTAIPSVTNGATPCYYWYNNDEASNKNTYGALYNWYAVNTGILAPRGWHVPSDDEWDLLVDCIKATGSRFTTILGGTKSGGGAGEYGQWWSSSKYGNYMPSSRYLKNIYSTYEYDETSAGSGLSVRCVKDPNVLAVKTISLNSVTDISVIIMGDVTNDGGMPVTERGICYSTTNIPTISNTKMAMGNGVGIFTNTITGLKPNTIYYARGYATNSTGTRYGDEISFKTFTGTATDIEGNVYLTVAIGDQIWMVENLKTTKYNDGTNIPYVTDNTIWAKLTSPGYCWYKNDAVTYKNTYGALYNWFTVSTGKLAPVGWHIPTDAEWNKLTTYLGGESVAGGKLKETGDDHWNGLPNNGASNETRFSALPGGERNVEGNYGLLGNYGRWWSSTEEDINNAKYRYIRSDLISFLSYNRNKESGFSVRCIKNNIPVLTSANASDITSNSAICGGSIAHDGGSAVTESGICYSTKQNPIISDNKIVIGSGTGNFSKTVIGLAPGTNYYLRAYATNSIGTAYGNEIVFRTFQAGSETITDIDGNVYHTVTIGTQVWLVENLKTTKYNDGTSIPNVTEDQSWGYLTTPAYCWYNNDLLNKNIYGALYNWHTVISGKLCPKGWHVPSDKEWTELINHLGGKNEAVKKLKEAGTAQWGANNTGATNESGFTALPAGERSNMAYRGFFNYLGKEGKWWSSTADGYSNPYMCYISYDYIGLWDAYQKDAGFSIRCIKGEVPEISTKAATNINSTSATVGGNITNDWGAVITARGVCWNTTGNPTLADNKTTDGTGTGSFTSNLASLTGNTTYYVRAYATNSVGTSYGTQITFTTFGPATISTSVATGITSISSICGGNITSDGGAPVTARGVCYSTNQNPTINSNKMTMGSGTGTFSIIVTGLSANTTYYLRAYATNSAGTAYGNEISFKTYPAGSEEVTDIEGNVYHTVTIGTQVWLIENLKTTKYNDGTSIPNVTNNTTWSNLLTPGYCWYNNEISNKNTYGALYNWYTIKTGKLCPTGWHVPTDAEWITLYNYLGGRSVAGGKLKESGTNHWNSPNTGATNETSFTALPGGTRNSNGFNYIKAYGFWWSSTEFNTIDAWEYYMGYEYRDLARSNDNKSYGHYVRCIKN